MFPQITRTVFFAKFTLIFSKKLATPCQRFITLANALAKRENAIQRVSQIVQNETEDETEAVS